MKPPKKSPWDVMSMAQIGKMKKPRKVFGRQTTKITGKPVTVEMHDGFAIARPFRSRKFWKLSLDKIAMTIMAEGSPENGIVQKK